VLKTLPAESVQCVVTSPPYWRQRDYGMAGQLGLEPTPEEYVARVVDLFREVRRVLRGDGTIWLNMGDKWASGGHGGGGSFMADRGEAWAHAKDAKGWRSPPAGYKDKDLVGVPWMTAFALRADGWFLRQCNIWAKPNTMPESVSDRSTISHEYVFHLSKRNDYSYNAEAARTPMEPSTETRLAQDVESQAGSARANGGAKTNGAMKAVRRSDKQRGHSRRHDGFNDRWDAMERTEQRQNGANLRSVWWIAPAQYREAHFAVMPENLATICIAAGSRPGDVVLDPFGGSGTVAAVATGMGRQSIYIDLNPAYLELAKQRIGALLCEVAVGDASPQEDGR
jgi:DNA modification methylase